MPNTGPDDVNRLRVDDELIINPSVIITDPGGLLGGGGVTDHGELSGLGDDDHTQYLNNTRHNALDHDAALTNTVNPSTGEYLKYTGSDWTTDAPTTGGGETYYDRGGQRIGYASGLTDKTIDRVPGIAGKQLEVRRVWLDLFGSTSEETGVTLKIEDNSDQSTYAVNGNIEEMSDSSKFVVSAGADMDVLISNSTGSDADLGWGIHYDVI